MLKKINPVLSWWLTPKLPAIHLEDKTGFIKKFVFHPLKRRLAKFYLNILQNLTDIKVIAITGSAGKTTTKEMLAAILSEAGKTVYSTANIDPVYNIPSTILMTVPGTKYLILEMGVEYPGEMDYYLWLAKPDIGVITNIFPTHTLFLGNIEGVFKEKSKLVYGLSKKGVAVLNYGDKKLKDVPGKIRAKTDWFRDDINPFTQNFNAAKAVAKTLGISEEKVKKGLSAYKNPPHRLELVKHVSGSIILDDSYNSNPWAAVATLTYFNGIAKGLKVAVLGDMLELGNFEEKGHRLVGREVAKSKFDMVIGVGKSSKFLLDEVRKNSKTKTVQVPDSLHAIPEVKKFLKPGTYILVKGSRSIGLDNLVAKLS